MKDLLEYSIVPENNKCKIIPVDKSISSKIKEKNKHNKVKKLNNAALMMKY